MIYWIIIIIILNVFVLTQPGAPQYVKLNAVMVSIIAFLALLRIYKKKRLRQSEQLTDKIKRLREENDKLRQRLMEEIYE